MDALALHVKNTLTSYRPSPPTDYIDAIHWPTNEVAAGIGKFARKLSSKFDAVSGCNDQLATMASAEGSVLEPKA